MSGDDIKQAIFGSSDGATTSLGIMATMWSSHHGSSIAPAVVGASLAATVGMGGSEYISDPESSVHRATVMALGTLIGGLWPAVPFFFGHSSALLATCAAAALVLGGIIVRVKVRNGDGWALSLAEVYGVFVAASVVATVAGLLAPGSSG